MAGIPKEDTCHDSQKQYTDQIPQEAKLKDHEMDTFPLVNGQYMYKGIRYPAFVVKEKLETMVDQKMHGDEWLVVGYPKSGTNWLHEIVYLIQKDGNVDSTFKTDIFSRTFLIETDYKAIDLSNQRLYKSHLSADFWPEDAKTKGVKIVYIVRDPRDVAVSFYNYYRAESNLGYYTGTWADFCKMFFSGRATYGGWFDHVKKWWQCKDQFNVLFITYEEMKRDILGSVSKIAEFVGKRLTQKEIGTIAEHVSFEHMKVNPLTNLSSYTLLDQKISPFHRKGEVGDWKNYFTVAQHDEFIELYKREMADIDLNITYI